jgi:hypothetical protein
MHSIGGSEEQNICELGTGIVLSETYDFELKSCHLLILFKKKIIYMQALHITCYLSITFVGLSAKHKIFAPQLPFFCIDSSFSTVPLGTMNSGFTVQQHPYYCIIIKSLLCSTVINLQKHLEN